jgi:hypothetical protein
MARAPIPTFPQRGKGPETSSPFYSLPLWGRAGVGALGAPAPIPTFPQRGKGQDTLTPTLSRQRERGQDTPFKNLRRHP